MAVDFISLGCSCSLSDLPTHTKIDLQPQISNESHPFYSHDIHGVYTHCVFGNSLFWKNAKCHYSLNLFNFRPILRGKLIQNGQQQKKSIKRVVVDTDDRIDSVEISSIRDKSRKFTIGLNRN